MNGIHDMGGMHGFGPVDTEADTPFHEAWEAEMHAIRVILGIQGTFNVDELRYACERLPPSEYLRATYYEIRLLAIERLLVERGILDPGELDERMDSPENGRPERDDPELRSLVRKAIGRDVSFDLESRMDPRFDPGDRVLVKNRHVAGHTRSPRYARRASGVVVKFHGVQRFPDASADGDPTVGDPLYSVRFTARELWGPDHPETDTIVLQLWERYLDAA